MKRSRKMSTSLPASVLREGRELLGPCRRAPRPRARRRRAARPTGAVSTREVGRPSLSPTGASSESSLPESRRSMSMTSLSGTSRRRASSADVGSMPICREALLLLVEVEEELALRLRGAELHQAPVVDDEPQDVRADPPRRVGRELHPAVRVVALHRLHEADVALLHEVHEVAVGAAVLVGDLHHQAEVRRDRRCIFIFCLV
jgi:hypothetical protein